MNSNPQTSEEPKRRGGSWAIGSAVLLVAAYFAYPSFALLPFLAAWKMHIISTEAALRAWAFVFTPANYLGNRIEGYDDYLRQTLNWDPTGLLQQLSEAAILPGLRLSHPSVSHLSHLSRSRRRPPAPPRRASFSRQMSSSPQKHTTRNATSGTVTALVVIYSACPLIFALPFLAAVDFGFVAHRGMHGANLVLFPAKLLMERCGLYAQFVNWEAEREPTGLIKKYAYIENALPIEYELPSCLTQQPPPTAPTPPSPSSTPPAAPPAPPR